MRKTYFKKLLCLLLSSVMLIPLSACGGSSGKTDVTTDITTGETTAAMTEEVAEPLEVIKDGTSEYRIVYPKNDYSDENEYRDAAQALSDRLFELTGARLAVIDDRGAEFSAEGFDATAEKLIIIGKTNIFSHKSIPEDELMYSQYTERCCGSSIVAMGRLAPTNALAAQNVTDDLTAMVSGNSLTIPGDFALNRYYDYEPTARDRKSLDEFTLTYFCGPSAKQLSEEINVERIAALGFTVIPVTLDPESAKTVLPLLEKYGLKASVADSRIARITASVTLPEDTDIDAIVSEVIADYAQYNNVIEWWLRDEPSVGLMPVIGKVSDAFARLDPDRTVFVNLGPNDEASEYDEMLGFYSEYVNPPFYSFDKYVFKNVNGRVKLKDNRYFENLASIYAEARRHGRDAAMIVLLVEHYMEGYDPYADIGEELLRWEVNMCLAYGCRSISYFTYIQPADYDWIFSPAITDRDCNPTWKYDVVKKINEWLLPIGRQLFDKNVEAVYHLTRAKSDGNVEVYEGYGDLGAVEGKRAVIGFYDDGSFYFVNKRYEEDDDGSVTGEFKFTDLRDGLEWFDPSDSAWKAAETSPAVEKTDGGYILTLGIGEGLLLRVSE